jgi:hypothetical protein
MRTRQVLGVLRGYIWGLLDYIGGLYHMNIERVIQGKYGAKKTTLK